MTDHDLEREAQELEIDLSGVRAEWREVPEFNTADSLRSRPVYLNEMGSDSDFMARAYFWRESDDDRVVLIAYGADRDSAYSKLSANLDLYAGDYELVDLEG